MTLLMQRLVIFILFLCCFNYSIQGFNQPSDFEKSSYSTKVLVFLSHQCPCSQSHVEHLNRLVKLYPAVGFFGVIVDRFSAESEKKIQSYFNQRKFKFSLIKDENFYLVKKYRALKSPHVVILRKEGMGNFKRIYQGGVSNNRDFSQATKKYLAENLKALSLKKELVYSKGKSFGCYIRRL